jgi:hypothetical protein
VYGVQKISEQFNDYLKKQEELAEKGDLRKPKPKEFNSSATSSNTSARRLMGAFSFGAGAMMWANMFNPKTITGAPISWILNGNPILEGVWLFGNGVICFKTGYEFFMIALEDQAEVQRMVKELKGLLPQQAQS